MDFNATIDLIIKDLDEARQIIDDLKKYKGVPLLQIELAKAKCKSAGEIISLLKNLNSYIPSGNETSFEPDQGIKKEIQLENESSASTFISDLPSEEELENIKESETAQKPAENIPAEDKKVYPELESPISSDNKQDGSKNNGQRIFESSIIADKFSLMSNRINEQLGSLKGDDDVSEKLKSKPVSNLSEAIGLNDKFLLIREIFNGNKDVYTRAISLIDSASNLKDARDVIKSYAGDKNENEAVKLLFDLVKRKFPSNE